MTIRALANLFKVRSRVRSTQQWLRFSRLYRKYKEETMVNEWDYIANLSAVSRILDNPQLAGGSIVECGTWRGGMSASLIEVGGYDRDYHFFDSFQGLPKAKEIDGISAAAWQANTDGDYYYDNCKATRDEFMKTISRTGVPDDRVHVYAGYFEQTLHQAKIPGIAVLRLDADWYESTLICLEKLFDRVLPSGTVLIDDYYTWDGCSRAVHDFLSRRKLSEKIQQMSHGLAVIVKSTES